MSTESADDTRAETVADETRARISILIAQMRERQNDLAATDNCTSAALGSAVLAIQYARQTMASVVGELEAEAQAKVESAIQELVDTSPEPWGDNALNDLGNITERSARLLSDVWMIGRLTAAVDPHSWSSDALVQQCLQVVAETHLAGKLRVELDGMFGETEEPERRDTD